MVKSQMHAAMPTEVTSVCKGEPSPWLTACLAADQLAPLFAPRHELPTKPPEGRVCLTNPVYLIRAAQQSCMSGACKRWAWGWMEKQSSVGSEWQTALLWRSKSREEPLECQQRPWGRADLQSCPLHALGGWMSERCPSTPQCKAKGPQSHCKMLRW